MAQIRQDLGVDEVSTRCRQGVDIDTLSVDIHGQVRQKCTKKRQNVDTSTPLRHLADTLSVDIFFLNRQRIPTVIGD